MRSIQKGKRLQKVPKIL